MTEPMLVCATIRETIDDEWQDIECQFSDGQKFAAIQVAREFDGLARLIAAAPDLLAALEVIVSDSWDEGETGEPWRCMGQDTYAKAHAAILKARGPQATSPYLNKPRRTVEQAVRDSEGK